MKRTLLVLALLCSAAKAELGATTERDSPFWTSPDSHSQPTAYLKKGTRIEVISKNAEGTFLHVEAPKENGEKVAGYVLAKDVRVDKASLAAAHAPKHVEIANEDPNRWIPDRRWSIGAGFSGYAIGDTTYVTVSGDIRYLWYTWLETISGLDLTFSKKTYFGFRLAQRVYAPSRKFRPYVHLGYRMPDVTSTKSSAWETGAGFQVVYGEGASYFDVGLVYLFRTPFDSDAKNGILFGGSSGLRF